MMIKWQRLSSNVLESPCRRYMVIKVVRIGKTRPKFEVFVDGVEHEDSPFDSGKDARGVCEEDCADRPAVVE